MQKSEKKKGEVRKKQNKTKRIIAKQERKRRKEDIDKARERQKRKPRKEIHNKDGREEMWEEEQEDKKREI